MSCPAILSGYSNPCRDYPGGVKKFYVTEKANIASYTVVSGVVTALTMNSGKKFWLWEQFQGAANFNEAPTTSDTGSYFVDQILTIRLDKREASKSYALRALAQQDLVFIEVEQTDEMFVTGLVNGSRMQPGNSPTGSAMGDHNGYALSFKASEREMAPTISQGILDTIIV